MCRCDRSRSWRAGTGAMPPPLPARAHEVALLYRGSVALLVKGAASGRVYALRPDSIVQCDGRDVTAFLASPLFERISS